MNLGNRARSVVLMVALGFAWASCTFPDVEYDSGSGAGADSACAVPMSCVNEVNTCRNKADALQNSCSMKCSGTCIDCEASYDEALASCVTQCENCSVIEGCMNATESCKALLGAP